METEQHASGSIIYIILVVGFAFGVSFASEMMVSSGFHDWWDTTYGTREFLDFSAVEAVGFRHGGLPERGPTGFICLETRWVTYSLQ